MYQHYFGLRALPFSIAPDPHYLYLSNQHREALAHLLYGVGEGGGFVLLTGEVGTGKTTVCRCLLQQLPERTELAFIVNPRQSPLELLASICDELGAPGAEGPDTIKHHTDRLMRHLLETHRRGFRTILVIDEAQNLGVDVLEQIRLLTNLETSERKLLQLILLGQPELNEVLARPDMRQFAQRITARYHLHALDLRDTRAYINHRLAVAGMYQELFPAWSVRRLYAASGGVPRLLNVLCDRVLLGVYAESARRVERRHVRGAVREVLGAPGLRARWPRWWPWAGAAAVLLTAALGLQAGSQFQPLPRWLAGIVPAAGSDRVLPFELGAGLAGLLALRDAAPLPATPDCASVTQRALACVRGRAQTATLAGLERPALLAVTGGYVLLLALGEEGARVLDGGGERTLDATALQQAWSADYLVLGGIAPRLAPGESPAPDTPALAAWLNQRLDALAQTPLSALEIDVALQAGAATSAAPPQAAMDILLAAAAVPAVHDRRREFSAELLARVEYFRAHAGLPPGGGVDRALVAALGNPGRS